MFEELYNYGLARHVESKKTQGMYSGSYQFTTNVYYDAAQAGRELGVDARNIEVVLKFMPDVGFTKGPDIDATPSRGFVGGASQYEHRGRPKPVAVRNIKERKWTRL